MVNCKRKDCQYADVMGGNRKTGTYFCDYIGYTNKMRGCYGQDVKNCDKYRPREIMRKPVQLFIGSEEWITSNAVKMREEKCLEENE